MIGLAMLLIVGGALLGTAPLAGVLSKSPAWFGLAGTAMVAGIVLLILGFVPVAAAMRGDFADAGVTPSEKPGDPTSTGSRRGPRPARLIGYLMIAIDLPMLVTVLMGKGDALSVFNVVLGLLLIVLAFTVDRWLYRRYERHDI